MYKPLGWHALFIVFSNTAQKPDDPNAIYLYLGLERKLKAGDEKLDQLTKDKAKLESNISDMVKSSGSSSEQLTKMNEELVQKER